MVRCPCYPPDDIEHGCGSVACAKDIEEQGKCHCRLFVSKIHYGGMFYMHNHLFDINDIRSRIIPKLYKERSLIV